MKRTTKNYLRETLLFALMITSLVGCGKKSDDEGTDAAALPASYSFGDEESIAAMLMPSQEITVSQKEMEENGTLYTYTNLSSAGEAAEQYVEQLTAEEPPFSLVDATCTPTEKQPDYEAEEGVAYLARNSTDGESINLITLNWNTDNECKVTVNEVDGQIKEVVAQEEASGSTGMTLPAAVSYFSGLSPEALGLTGESMDDYNIYALDGTVMVDGEPCLHLKVCSNPDPDSKANSISGDYLMSGDEKKIYRLDTANGTVTELSI
jgi:hypothetical protein